MKVYVQSQFDCPPEAVWAKVQSSDLLLEVIRPLLRFAPLGSAKFPSFWRQGQTVYGRAYAFGLLPLGVHAVHFERIDARERQMQTREIDPLIRRWDHLISVAETPDGKTVYSDEIDVDAGIFTFFVWVYAQLFYRHRQRRWRRVVQRLSADIAARRRKQ